MVDTRAMLDVFAPNITYPDAQTVWPGNSTQKVTWDVTNPPAQITNLKGEIRLVSDETILPVIMAERFDILAGNVSVYVPCVVSGIYKIVLLGDSGDWSQPFKITAP